MPIEILIPKALASCLVSLFIQQPFNIPYQVKVWSDNILNDQVFTVTCGDTSWVITPTKP